MYEVIFIFAIVGTCSDLKRETKGSFVEWILRTCLKTRLRITVRYLPPVPFSPTETKVIAAEIRRTQDIKKKFEMCFIFSEADQAIYTKVLDLMFTLKNKG